jgi:hypothetical protein
LLDKDFIDHIFDILIKSTRQYLDIVSNRTDISNEQRRYLDDQIGINIELLSLFSIKIDTVHRFELLNFAIEAYNNSYLQNHHLQFYETIGNLFKRILFALDDNAIIEKISTLLSLSIENKLCEPFNYISWTSLRTLTKNYNRSNWDNHISEYLEHLKNGDREVRKRALQRLLKLYEINSLKEEEKKSFAENLWFRLDNNQIPVDTDLMVFSFLNLPNKNIEDTKKTIHDFLVKSDFKRVVEYSTNKKSRSYSGPENKDLIDSLHHSTAPIFQSEENKNKNYIDWSNDDIVNIFNRILLWWEDEKSELDQNSIIYSFSPFDSVKTSFQYLIPLLREVIFPRITIKDQETKDKALLLLNEMERKGLCVLSVWPMILFFDNTYYDKIVDKIRACIVSNDKDILRESIHAIYFWFAERYKFKDKILEPPIDLLNELIHKIKYRIEPELETCIFYLYCIIKYMPFILDEEHFKGIINSLQYLKDETKLMKEDLSAKVTNQVKLQTENKLEIRASSAKLSYILFKYYKNNNKEIPEIIMNWKEICKTELLPEIHKAWEEYDY